MALAFIKLETLVEVKFRGNEKFPDQRLLIDYISKSLNSQFELLFQVMEDENMKVDIKDILNHLSLPLTGDKTELENRTIELATERFLTLKFITPEELTAQSIIK